jgi:ABC-type branched-subunit amino acid transport system ATPase component
MAPLIETPLIQTDNLTLHFGGLKAVDGVDFTLNAGEIHALIGPNGAGKTTFVSLLSASRNPGRSCWRARTSPVFPPISVCGRASPIPSRSPRSSRA